MIFANKTSSISLVQKGFVPFDIKDSASDKSFILFFKPTYLIKNVGMIGLSVLNGKIENLYVSKDGAELEFFKATLKDIKEANIEFEICFNNKIQYKMFMLKQKMIKFFRREK